MGNKMMMTKVDEVWLESKRIHSPEELDQNIIRGLEEQEADDVFCVSMGFEEAKRTRHQRTSEAMQGYVQEEEMARVYTLWRSCMSRCEVFPLRATTTIK